MPEPRGTATYLGEVVRGIHRFMIHDERIDAESDCYAVVDDDSVVLIDPLPLEGHDLHRLGSVEAICLTASCHERSAWRYRELFDVPVYAPVRGVDFEGRPDRWYAPDDRLPGGLRAIHSPGPTDAHYSFHLPRRGGAVFCADLLTHYEGADLAFVPGEYQDDPASTRSSVRRLLDLPFRILCPNHGAPVTTRAKAAMRAALRRDARSNRQA